MGGVEGEYIPGRYLKFADKGGVLDEKDKVRNAYSASLLLDCEPSIEEFRKQLVDCGSRDLEVLCYFVGGSKTFRGDIGQNSGTVSVKSREKLL